MDDKLSRALRSLPRDEARPGFSDAVRRRIEERRDEDRRAPWRWLAPWQMRPRTLHLAVAAACLLVLVLGIREWAHHDQRRQTLARVEKLEAERQALVAELESLYRQKDMAQPVVYLGGNDDLDVVLDLAELRRTDLRPGDPRTGQLPSPAPRTSESQPAGLRTAKYEDPRRPTIY